MIKTSEQKKMERWIRQFRRDGIPRCGACGSKMKNGVYDPISKRSSKYLWRCPVCIESNVIISVG